ncbi:Scr1 family TA system antitoxin-like transcriptional regulator [Streptomyces sp. ICBB 8177]|uniref:Scr1 family TA system antitoxin-like transcriptional regulator n=1 Tax=Streptomyces sp. ICBB 8177 TaxID=563922 RepID=UPI000D6757CD|nr:Scr1 family TA system antitoxin-like transcriptional regulator [Streptomyces sp. ICBB 8177]PWI43047.1 hypothetical protein CK485_12570 [Streptomyces sp. ICBB 8177]
MSSPSPRPTDGARHRLGVRMRELRDHADLSVEALAVASGISPMEISQIEAGRRVPTRQEIAAWCAWTRAEQQTESLIAAVAHLDRAPSAKPGPDAPASEGGFFMRNEESGHLRVYEHKFIPSLLQTDAYARAHLTKILSWRGAMDSFESAIRELESLQRQLRENWRRYTFLVDELALYTKVCATGDMAAQLAHLDYVATLPNVELGVVPSDAEPAVWPSASFWLHETHVRVDALTGERQRVVDSRQVAEYHRAFHAVAVCAAYGATARGLIVMAAEYWDQLTD